MLFVLVIRKYKFIKYFSAMLHNILSLEINYSWEHSWYVENKQIKQEKYMEILMKHNVAYLRSTFNLAILKI